MSRVHTYYLPTYLADKTPSTAVTLMVRKYQKYKNSKGTYTTRYRSDAIQYPTEQAMAAAIGEEKCASYRLRRRQTLTTYQSVTKQNTHVGYQSYRWDY